MKLLYKPFGLFAALIAARVGKSVFAAIWAKIDDVPPPHPTAPSATFGKAVGGQALQAATMAGAGATADRLGATFFYHLTGAWPGKDPKPADD
jgi:uncharacterized membrane protein YdcZ (DUF606 family)